MDATFFTNLSYHFLKLSISSQIGKKKLNEEKKKPRLSHSLTLTKFRETQAAAPPHSPGRCTGPGAEGGLGNRRLGLGRPRSLHLSLSRQVITLKTLHLSAVAVIVLSPLKWPFLRVSSHRSAPQPADPRAFLWVQGKLSARGTLGPASSTPLAEGGIFKFILGLSHYFWTPHLTSQEEPLTPPLRGNDPRRFPDSFITGFIKSEFE